MKNPFSILVSFLVVSCVNHEMTSAKGDEATKESIVQSILDHEKLQQFLHPEVSGRIPLVVSDHLIGQNLGLKKFGEKVKIISDKEANGAYLKFTLFDCRTTHHCSVRFEYPVEGVMGQVEVEIRRDDSPRIKKIRISER